MSDRKPLTKEEASRPYAKYYYMQQAGPNPALMELLNMGPMDPAKALHYSDINELLDPGYHEVETGYCVMDDGVGYVAVNNAFPGVSVEMMDWWFAWHALEDLRYRIWCPEKHFGISVDETVRKKLLDPNVALTDKSKDVTHIPYEDIGVPAKITITFLRPESMGFDMSRFHEPNVATVYAGFGLTDMMNGGPPAPATMLHFVRKTPEGIEFRTRFWMGTIVQDGTIAKILPPGVKLDVHMPMGLAYHNVEEYSNLAAILPEIYKENGPEITIT